MAQYLGAIAKAAATSFGEGDNRSRGKKDNDLVTRLEGQAVKAIGSQLLSGDAMGPTSHPKRVGQLFNSVSSWHQDNYGGASNGGRRGMTSNGYDELGGNQRGGYGYDDTRGGGYGGGSGNGGYGYESRTGYGGEAGWNAGAMNGGSGGLGRQGYYDNSNYDGYGNRGRMNDGYMGGGGYGY